MEMQQLDPDAKKMWRVTRLIGLIAIAGLCIAAFFLIGRRIGYISPLQSFLILMIPVLLQVINVLAYPAIEYRQWSYLITADRIEIKKGIFFHSTRVVPISRIQHVTVSEGPVARFFKLAAVTVHTAGGAFRIEGLARAEADTICDNLKDVVNRKIGVR